MNMAQPDNRIFSYPLPILTWVLLKGLIIINSISNFIKYSEEEKYAFLQKIVYKANKGGRVNLEAHGLENIPKEDGFIMYPNHQGMYDMLAIINVIPRPISCVMKKEVANVPFLKQVELMIRINWFQ